jgi:uncharacterized caspase-like protein
VVVGISKYQQSEISLKYADKDAEAFYQHLQSPFGGKVTEETSVLLLNEKATREKILEEITEKCNKAAKEDILIIYFACHGMTDANGEEVFLLSHDAKVKNLAGTAVSQFDIDRAIKRSRAEKKIWIADACHSGLVSISARGDFAYLTNQLLAAIASKSEGYIFLSASSSNEFSREDKRWGEGHGVFTYYLLEGLKGAADKNNDGFIDTRELHDYVYRKVNDDTNGEQHPDIKFTKEDKIPIGIIKKEKMK